jgi:Flp pilus assembly CpaE family ATPase
VTQQIPLLHIEPDEQTAEFIRHTLQQGDYAVTSIQTGKEGLIAAWRDQPEIILCELDLPDIDGFELLEKLRKDQRTQKTTIVALTSSNDPASAVRAKEAGVDRYFVKQPGAVDMLIDFLATGEQAFTDRTAHHVSAKAGKITSLMGIKGGTGTSSIALNIAHQLGLKLGEGRVLAMDFDLPIGSLATISGAKTRLTLDELLDQEPQALVNMAIHEELEIPKSWSCAVLPGFKRPLPIEDWSSGNIPALLQFLRNLYEHVVIDVGRDLSPPGQAVLAQSDHILLILQPDEECVGRAKSIFSYLRKLGTDRDKISFITNRPMPIESLTTRSTEEALGHTLLGAVPHMGEQVTLVNTLHAPIALRFPETRGNILIQEIAESLTKEELAQRPGQNLNVRS